VHKNLLGQSRMGDPTTSGISEAGLRKQRYPTVGT
jgi:hypothetical protein